jgi:hypothetical protein
MCPGGLLRAGLLLDDRIELPTAGALHGPSKSIRAFTPVFAG